MWRTSWLSREVIVLPAFMACVFAYGLGHALGWPASGPAGTLAIGALGLVLCAALFVCTAMIYACLRFLQEWHSPLTVVNYVLFGCASGLMLAAGFAALVEPPLDPAARGVGGGSHARGARHARREPGPQCAAASRSRRCRPRSA